MSPISTSGTRAHVCGASRLAATGSGSKQSPIEPVDGTSPAAWTRCPNAQDVYYEPFAADPTKVQLELSAPSGQALFMTCARTLHDFLQSTYAAVPPGTEAARIDVDLALAALLDL